MKIEEVKNEIVLRTDIDGELKIVELYDFTSLDHIYIDNVSYIRILCGNKFYYYRTTLTSIVYINIYR